MFRRIIKFIGKNYPSTFGCDTHFNVILKVPSTLVQTEIK